MADICQAKQPSMLFPRMWVICGEPATMTYDYRCACGHSRQGSTCNAHRPAPDEVGCSRCWDSGHECPMTASPVLTPSADLPACRDENPAWSATLAACYPDPPDYQHPEEPDA